MLILTAGLLFLSVCAIVVAGILHLWPGPVSLTTPVGQSLALAVFCWWVNVVLVGYRAISMHAALGRDLGDSWLTTRAQHLSIFLSSFWIAFSAAGGLLILWTAFELNGSRVFAPPLPFTSFLIDMTIILLMALEGFYLSVINHSRLLLRMTICEPWELHADRDHPGVPT